MLLATVISEPDLQKVKTNAIPVRPGFVCTCARMCADTCFLLRLWGAQGQRSCQVLLVTLRVPFRAAGVGKNCFGGLGSRWGEDFSQALIPHLTLNLNHRVGLGRPYIPCCWDSGTAHAIPG